MRLRIYPCHRAGCSHHEGHEAHEGAGNKALQAPRQPSFVAPKPGGGHTSAIRHVLLNTVGQSAELGAGVVCSAAAGRGAAEGAVHDLIQARLVVGGGGVGELVEQGVVDGGQGGKVELPQVLRLVAEAAAPHGDGMRPDS